MEVIVIQVFVSLLLVVGSVLLFLYSVKQGDADHHDRMSLFPIEEDDLPSVQPRPALPATAVLATGPVLPAPPQLP